MDMDAQDLHDVERAEISPISWTGRLMFSVNQIFLCLGFGAGTHFFLEPAQGDGGWQRRRFGYLKLGWTNYAPNHFLLKI